MQLNKSKSRRKISINRQWYYFYNYHHNLMDLFKAFKHVGMRTMTETKIWLCDACHLHNKYNDRNINIERKNNEPIKPLPEGLSIVLRQRTSFLFYHLCPKIDHRHNLCDLFIIFNGRSFQIFNKSPIMVHRKGIRYAIIRTSGHHKQTPTDLVFCNSWKLKGLSLNTNLCVSSINNVFIQMVEIETHTFDTHNFWISVRRLNFGRKFMTIKLLSM